MAYKAILFDMDGTLLPMDIEVYKKCYFGSLCKIAAPYGVAPDALIGAVLSGLSAMAKNDGTCSNKDAFMQSFNQEIKDAEKLTPLFDDYYKKGFYDTKAASSDNPLARTAVELAKGQGRKVVLATNPVFPMDAQIARMSFVGLTSDDFEFVTAYEEDCFTKPNPNYYLSICERLGVSPQDCLMVGNDELEDMYGASLAGMDCFLVTDCIIKSTEHPWQGRRGTFSELVEYLKTV